MKSIKEVVKELREKGELDEKKLSHFRWQQLLAYPLYIGMISFGIALFFFASQAWIKIFIMFLIFVTGRCLFRHPLMQRNMFYLYNLGEKVSGDLVSENTGLLGLIPKLYYEFQDEEKVIHKAYFSYTLSKQETASVREKVEVVYNTRDPSESTLFINRYRKHYYVKK